MKTVPYLILAVLLLSVQTVAAAAKVEVKVEGVEGELGDNVLAFLSLAQQKDTATLSAEEIRRLHQKAPDEIRAALEPFGYYRPTVQSELVTRDSGWLARYRVDPGPPLKVSDVDLRITGEGSKDPKFKKLARDFPIKQGETLHHADYEQGKGNLQKVAAERGYLDAKLNENEIRVDLEKYSARIVLHYDTGPRYHFGPVSFKQEGFKEKFLRRFVPIKPGDPYTASRLLDLQNAFSDSDYFTRVEVEPRRDLAKGQRVPVEVRLEPKKRDKYIFGLGYGTDTGPRGSVGFERRRVNSLGHRFDANLEASQIRRSLTARYRIPLANPRTDQLSFNLGIADEDTGTSQSKTALVGVSRTVAHGAWSETLSLNYQRELFEVAGQRDQSTLLIPGVSWSRILTNDRIYTTRGSRIQLDLRGAAEPLLSDTTFLQGRAQGKFIRALGERGRVILRGDLGYTEVSDVENLPATLRFFAGGDTSVRGYDFNSLGPENEDGEVIGGKYLLVGSVEYEQRLTEKWGAAVFFDAGNALNSLSDSLKEGAGVGVRWLSPVGLVRVDLAVPFDQSQDTVRLHINIGPDL